MERRFRTVFDELADRRTRGESFRSALRGSTNEELVGALAAAGTQDAVAANAIATELLNRMRLAPFRGAFIVSMLVVVLIYALDYIYTGTFLLLDTSPRANILAAVSGTIAIASLLSLLMWRGRLQDLRMRIVARHRDY